MTVCSPDLKEERRLRSQGYESVAGLDEVGRGAWAGPLTVGVAVVRPRVQLRSMPAWLRDSKMLSEARREEIFPAVGAWCQAWSVGHASPAECDEWGMTEALRVAARRALAGLGEAPQAVLVDGPVDLLRHPDDPFGGAVRPIVDGDAKCASVAAASVLAKVVRDRIMRQEADHFPAYAFERNKGYPSPVHQTALRGYGPTAIHRSSWAFVRDLPWCGQGRRGRSDDCGDLGEVAGDGVSLAPVDEGRLFGDADLLRLPAAGAEAAARGR
jgi:ribonuclease HII